MTGTDPSATPSPEASEAHEVAKPNIDDLCTLYEHTRRLYEAGVAQRGMVVVADPETDQLAIIERTTAALTKEQRPPLLTTLGRLITGRYDTDQDGPNSVLYVIRLSTNGQETRLYLVAPRRNTNPSAHAITTSRADGTEYFLYSSPGGVIMSTTDDRSFDLTNKQLGQAHINAVAAQATDLLLFASPITPDQIVEVQQRGACSEVYGEEAANFRRQVLQAAISAHGVTVAQLSRSGGIDVQLPVKNPGYQGQHAIRAAWVVSTENIYRKVQDVSLAVIFKDSKLILSAVASYAEGKPVYCRVRFCLPGVRNFDEGQAVKLLPDERARLYDVVSKQLAPENSTTS